MGEFNQFLKMTNMSKFKTSIIKYPSGKYGFVGSIPENLCYFDNKGLFPQWKSKIFNTYEEAEKALNMGGIKND